MDVDAAVLEQTHRLQQLRNPLAYQVGSPTPGQIEEGAAPRCRWPFQVILVQAMRGIPGVVELKVCRTLLQLELAHEQIHAAVFRRAPEEEPLPQGSSEVVPSLRVLRETEVEGSGNDAWSPEKATQQHRQQRATPPPDEHG